MHPLLLADDSRTVCVITLNANVIMIIVNGVDLDFERKAGPCLRLLQYFSFSANATKRVCQRVNAEPPCFFRKNLNIILIPLR